VSEPLAIDLAGVGAVESYEEHVMAWHHLDGHQDDLNWFRGALAASVDKRYGEAKLERFAQDVGRPYRRVCEYRQVFQEFQNGGRPPFSPLKFEHYRLSLEAPKGERLALLEEAATTASPVSEKLPWPTRELKEVIKERWPAPTAPPAAGTYPTIVIDPPWAYDNKATRGAASNHYETMTFEQLETLEIPAADNAHLYLWVTNGFLREGLDLLQSWGFDYKTMLTWVKPQIGLGNYFRSATEHVLFGLKGSLPTQGKETANWFKADRTKHSQKPELFYDIVEKVSPEPWFEMFARRTRFGWTTWGDQA
jgi:N6-adenosine-specific RNA methylase IME4